MSKEILSLGVIVCLLNAAAQVSPPLASNAPVYEVAKEFFTHLLLYPFEHLPAILFLCLPFAASIIGIAFLVKWYYSASKK